MMKDGYGSGSAKTNAIFIKNKHHAGHSIKIKHCNERENEVKAKRLIMLYMAEQTVASDAAFRGPTLLLSNVNIEMKKKGRIFV